MSDWDFWTAEFEGTEKQVAYASDVRDYVSDCIDTVRECAIKCDNSEDDADAIKQAILDGIEMDVANHGGINDNKIWAGKFLDSVLAAFPLKELISGTHYFNSMNEDNLVNYAHLGGYEDLVIYYLGSYRRRFPYLVAGHTRLEEAREAAKSEAEELSRQCWSGALFLHTSQTVNLMKRQPNSMPIKSQNGNYACSQAYK